MDRAISQRASPAFTGKPFRPGARSVAMVLLCSAAALTFLAVGVCAPALAPHNPAHVSLFDKLTPPAWQAAGSWSHPLGTDNLGRDELSRLIYGTRVSLTVIAVTIPGAAAIGLLLGIVAGWKGGLWDAAIMAVVDVQLALPAILFAVLLAALFGPSLRNVILVIVLWSWSSYTRVIRAEVLGLRQSDFVLAARATGAGGMRIVLRHLLPNTLSSIVVLATLEIAAVVITEAALSFLGVGVANGTASWGSMIAEGRSFMTIAWWPVAIPGAAIFAVSLTGNVFGDWLRDALDPKLRGRR